ncbi:MAG: carbohydrate kinase family protein, partial [Chloroflexota bacterium]
DDEGRLAALGLTDDLVAQWCDRQLLVPCFSTTVVGTTGAGDCTIAGFLAGLLHKLSLPQIMTGAVGVGACNVEQVDATSGVPLWETVQQRIEAGWAQLPVSLPLPGWVWNEDERLWVGPKDQVSC